MGLSTFTSRRTLDGDSLDTTSRSESSWQLNDKTSGNRNFRLFRQCPLFACSPVFNSDNIRARAAIFRSLRFHHPTRYTSYLDLPGLTSLSIGLSLLATIFSKIPWVNSVTRNVRVHMNVGTDIVSVDNLISTYVLQSIQKLGSMDDHHGNS